MKIKRNDISVLFKSLGNLGELQGARFAYTISKNFKKLLSEVEAINEAKKNDKEYTEYEDKRIELAKKFAEKDENGEPIIKNNEYTIEDIHSFVKELNKLGEEYKLEEITKFLDEEVELNLHMIKPDDLPENITVAQLDSISKLIEE